MYNLQSQHNCIVNKSNDDNIDIKVNHRRNAELELHSRDSVDRNIGKVSVNKRKIHQSTVLCLFIETNQIHNKHLQCIHAASLANIILV